MKLTPKLNLKKPDLTDNVNIQDLNENMDVLDTAVSELQEGATSIPDLETNDKTLAGAINELKQTVNDVQTNAKEYTDQHFAAVDTKVENHIEEDDGHVRYLGSSSATNDMIVSNDNLTLPLESDGKIKIGSAFRFRKDTTNTGALTMQLKLKGITYPKYQVLTSRGKTFTGGEMIGGGMYTLVFNGSAFFLQGEGGGYYKDDLIKAQDLINRSHIMVNTRSYINPNDKSKWGYLLNHEIAAINGVEYAFSYVPDTRDSYVFCTEVLTGKIVWTKNVKYSYNTRMVVHNGKLYLGYGDYDGVIGGGYGLETMDALTGATLTTTKVTPPSSYATSILDICLTDVSGSKEIMAIIDNYNDPYGSWLVRFKIDGTLLSISSNLMTYYTHDRPGKIQYANGYVFVASGKAIYQFTVGGFTFVSKVALYDSSYGLLSIAANNINGVSCSDYMGYITVFASGLVQQAKFSVNGYQTSGLVIKGDLMGYASPGAVNTYRLSADGKSATWLDTVDFPTEVTDVSTSKQIGLSENAIVPPKYTSNEKPTVFAKVLKLRR